MNKINNYLLNSLPLQGKDSTLKAFTLVELIVVITILAILGTIAFISLQGYSQDSRDAVRISDIGGIKTSVELFQLGSGKYPLPTDITNITYSGSIAWSQGFFGEETFKNVTNLDKIPTDPSTDKQYVYSVTNTRQEYQVAGIIEGEIAYNPSPLTPLLWSRGEQVQAAQKTATLRISGTYNGKILKVSTGGTDYVLAIPSIITSSGFTVEQIATNDYFAYNGYKNLPAQYAGGTYNVLGEEGLSLVDGNNILVYSGSVLTLSSTKQDGIDARKLMLENLQTAYAGSKISNIGEISEILSLNTASQEDTEKLSSTIVSNNLGGSVITSTGGGSDGGDDSGENIVVGCNVNQPTNATIESGEPTESNQAWQSINPTNPCYFKCNSGYGSTGTGCIFASNCTTGLTEITLTNGQTWSCMNLGATTVWDGTTQPTNCGGTSTTNCNAGLTWLGDYYQWGRNDSVNTSSTQSTYSGPFTGLLGHNNFVLGDSSYSDWWQNEAGSTTPTRWTGINPQGPCPVGWHVPSQTEWKTACDTISGTSCANNTTTVNAMKGTLKLPFAGKRDKISGYYDNQTSLIIYWTSTSYSNRAYNLILGPSSIFVDDYNPRASGFSIRCLKN